MPRRLLLLWRSLVLSSRTVFCRVCTRPPPSIHIAYGTLTWSIFGCSCERRPTVQQQFGCVSGGTPGQGLVEGGWWGTIVRFRFFDETQRSWPLAGFGGLIFVGTGGGVFVRSRGRRCRGRQPLSRGAWGAGAPQLRRGVWGWQPPREKRK
jgi:hypothetical protein